MRGRKGREREKEKEEGVPCFRCFPTLGVRLDGVDEEEDEKK